jgi:hypothetical protein
MIRSGAGGWRREATRDDEFLMGSMVIELQASFEPISCATIVEGQKVRCRIGQPCRPTFNSKDGGGGEARSRTSAGLWWLEAGWYSHAGSHATSNQARPCG